MRYLILDRTKLNLWAIERITELEDMGFIDEEESLAKFKEIFDEGLSLGEHLYSEYGENSENYKFWDDLKKEL